MMTQDEINREFQRTCNELKKQFQFTDKDLSDITGLHTRLYEYYRGPRDVEIDVLLRTQVSLMTAWKLVCMFDFDRTSKASKRAELPARGTSPVARGEGA